LFTALVVTRLIFDFLLNRGWLNKVGMMHIIKNPEWDFMKWTKLAYIGSAPSSWPEWGTAFHRGGKVMGPEFAGGDAVTLNFTNKVEVDKLRPKCSSRPWRQIRKSSMKRAPGAGNLENRRPLSARPAS
jgi:SecD/SecF fusion protein